MKRVLVISPHPDDEAIGCGGTLRGHVLRGDSVHVIFVTSGEKGGHGRSPEETIPIREGESERARQILGVERIEFWRERDGRIQVRPPIVHRLATKLRKWSPDVVYVPHDREMHADHRAAARLVRAAFGVLAGNGQPIHADVLMYEVWTPLTRMDEIIDISAHVQVKRKAIRAYRSQCAVMDFDDAILGLNRYRGEMYSWPEGTYAEVFARLEVGCRK
jgi:LmbE family N-acetylglucosaminyl deacetylase